MDDWVVLNLAGQCLRGTVKLRKDMKGVAPSELDEALLDGDLTRSSTAFIASRKRKSVRSNAISGVPRHALADY